MKEKYLYLNFLIDNKKINEKIISYLGREKLKSVKIDIFQTYNL